MMPEEQQNLELQNSSPHAEQPSQLNGEAQNQLPIAELQRPENWEQDDIDPEVKAVLARAWAENPEEAPFVLPPASKEQTILNRSHIQKRDVQGFVKCLLTEQRGVKLYRTFIILFGAAFIIYGLLQIVQILRGHSQSLWLSAILVILLGSASIWLAIWGIISQTAKRVLRNTPNILQDRHYRVTPIGISCGSESGQSVAFRWSALKRWEEDERCFFLRLDQHWMLIQKEGFQQGKAEDLRLHLESACPRENRKKRAFWGHLGA